MDIMREYKVPVPKGFMATGPAEAQELYNKEIGAAVPVVVKAMVLAGQFYRVNTMSLMFTFSWHTHSSHLKCILHKWLMNENVT